VFSFSLFQCFSAGPQRAAENVRPQNLKIEAPKTPRPPKIEPQNKIKRDAPKTGPQIVFSSLGKRLQEARPKNHRGLKIL
jgi:hypothetical protein